MGTFAVDSVCVWYLERIKLISKIFAKNPVHALRL